MIQINNLSKSYGEQNVLISATCTLGPRDRVGFVGKNGAGKSTLFKLIMGQEKNDGGDIVIPKNYKIALLDQHIHFTKDTVLNECIAVLDPKNYDEYLAEKILFGLGFGEEDLIKDPRNFSGGWQIRINLAKVLLKAPNLMLLDEPTNYLDIVSMKWLIAYLKNFPGEVIIISHDRDFLDAVSTHTMGIYRNTLKKVKGDTAKYYEQIILEEEIYEKTRVNLEKKKSEMRAFVERFKAKASKAAQAQSRQKSLERMGDMEALSKEERLGFKFRYTHMPAKKIGEIIDVSFNYPEGPTLFSHISFDINKEDRIAIIGANGKGKSTMLNIIAGELEAKTGSTKFHNDCRIGHFGQTNIVRLKLDHTIAEEIQNANGDLAISSVRNICGTMMFEGDLAKKKIKVLSGGERARVLLGKILATPHNLLLLDEPTNHLDIESIEALTDELVCFPGAILIVTHSETLIRNLANKLVVFHQNKAEVFHGTYDEFLAKGGDLDFYAPEHNLIKSRNKKSLPMTKVDREKLLKPIREKIAAIENEIVEFENLQQKIILQMNSLSDPHEIANYSGAIGKLDRKIEELFSSLELANNELNFESKNFNA